MNTAPSTLPTATVVPVVNPSSDQAGELRPLIVASDDLLQGRRELWIEHRGELYRLRVTSAGKLYMTK